MNKIKVGDIVKVTNWGKRYSTYTDFFDEHCMLHIPLSAIASYESDTSDFKENNYDFKVLFIGKHISEDTDIAFIMRMDEYDNCYTFLVSTEGLKKDVKKVTYKELKDMLGYDFEIVD